MIGGKRFVHETIIRVRFCETDANRHVSQVSYAIYFEQARTEFFDALMDEGFDWWSSQFSMVLAHQSITYLAPAFYRQTLRIYTGVSAIGRSSLGLYHLVVDSESGTLIANQDSTVVLVDALTQKSHSWPDSFRTKITPLLPES
ncbi:acyl-CoA thioesterase [Sulfobacillus thermotolerans]|uniref:acyl-CoA thioesterase n=1 Tax=Sulfobacillus thermotolerans TaxID=338644 RepID=UPI00336800F1